MLTLAAVPSWLCSPAFWQVADPWDGADVLPLKNLHSLQHLSNQSTTYLLGRPLLSAELAAGLTSLTELLLGGCRVGVLRHVSSCVALRNLYVGCAAGTKEELGQAEWAALGCLTGLTRLKLPNAKVVSASPECCAAVNSLSRLQTAEADLWSLDMLSALSSCSYLSHMSGAWEQRGVTAEGVVLPSVVSLSQTGGSPPFAAFPNLTEIEQHDWLVVQAYAGIAQHCTGLTELTVDDYPRSSTSLAPAAEPLARIGAIKSLSALTQLTRLDFMVQDNTELAVLVDVAAGLLLLELKRLDVLLLYNSPRLHVGALMHLAKLRGLEALSLELLADRVVADLLKDTDNFLMALSDIGVVGLMLRKQEDLDVVEAACARLKGSGLPCPNKVNLSITDNVARQPV
jgi:hypothetical protein